MLLNLNFNLKKKMFLFFKLSSNYSSCYAPIISEVSQLHSLMARYLALTITYSHFNICKWISSERGEITTLRRYWEGTWKWVDEEEGKTMTEVKYQTQMMPATHHDHTKVKAKTFFNVADTFHITPLKNWREI